MAQTTRSRHIKWNRGEYRTEHASNENAAEYAQGFDVGENVDLTLQEVVHKRGGFKLEDGSFEVGADLGSDNNTPFPFYAPSSSALGGTTVTGFYVKDWKVAQFDSAIDGMVDWVGVVAAELGPSFGSGRSVDCYGYFAFSADASKEVNLSEKVSGFVSKYRDLMRNNFISLRKNNNRGVSLDGSVFYDRTYQMGGPLLIYRARKGVSLSASQFRIEKLSSRKRCFIPPRIVGSNPPLMIGEHYCDGDWDLYPWGTLGAAAGAPSASNSLRRVRNFWGSMAEMGFGGIEYDQGAILLPGPYSDDSADNGMAVRLATDVGRILQFDGDSPVTWTGTSSLSVTYHAKEVRPGAAFVTETEYIGPRSKGNVRRTYNRYVGGKVSAKSVGEQTGSGNTAQQVAWTVETESVTNTNGVVSDRLTGMDPMETFAETVNLNDRMEGVEAYWGQAGLTNKSEDGTGWFWKRAYVCGRVLDRMVQMTGQGGAFLAFMAYTGDNVDGQILKGEQRWYLVRVIRGKGLGSYLARDTKIDETNCWLGFKVRTEDEERSREERKGKDFYFPNLDVMFNVVNAQTEITTFRLPHWSLANGTPRNLSKINGRTVLSGWKTNQIVYSAAGLPTFIDTQVPDQFSLGEKKLKEVVDSDFRSAPKPNSRASKDEVFYRHFEITGGSDPGAFIPYTDELTVEDDATPLWVGGQEGAVIGTSSGEIAAGALIGGATRYDSFISNRGSGSSLIAKGDASIFFIGPGGREIYQVFFRRGRSGMVTRSITKEGGDFIQEGVIDMKWDFQRKALWVLYGKGDLALYFSDVEYDIMGWTRYGFGDSMSFGGKALVRMADKTVGVIRNDLKLYSCPVPYAASHTLFRDEVPEGEDGDYLSRTKFFVTVPGGSLGEGSNFTKRGRSVILKLSGATRLLLGKDKFAKSIPGDRRKEAKVDLANYINDSNFGFRIPTVEVAHKGNERMFFVSLGYAVEVNEA